MEAPTASQSAASAHDFYIETKEGVDKILIFSKTGLYLGEMKKCRGALPHHIYNGTCTEEEIITCLLGGQGKTSYTFNNLFSRPLNMETIQELIKQKVQLWRNNIIINTPKELHVQFVTVTFPKVWQNFWKIPKIICLYPVNKDKVTIEGEGKPSDFFKLGIDPTGDNFIASVELSSDDHGYFGALGPEELNKLLTNKITIHCYASCFKQRYHWADGDYRAL
jgi:hypothetical protein